MPSTLFATCLMAAACAAAGDPAMIDLYRAPEGIQSRWTSFENPTGAPGQGGQANRRGKGAAFRHVDAGETVTLLDMEGSGLVHRMWLTLSDRSPAALRSHVLRMYWDGAETPAVEAPLGDFFGHLLGHSRPFENALFSSPEGRSFNAVVPMPFRTRARITFTNESDTRLDQLFYDINLSLGVNHPDDVLYFHAHWRRERWTALGRDFDILPRVQGRGRFLGAHVGVIGHPDNVGWWGEGEVKMYLDGDGAYPTIVGTGTEDYVGTAYGQGEFVHRYQGSPVIDENARHYAFYRYHIPDPIHFQREIRVSIQQMGGADKAAVLDMIRRGVEITPVSVHDATHWTPLLERDLALDDPSVPNGWTNYFRRDDVCALALFYLDRPANELPRIAPVEKRVEALRE